MIMRYKSWEKPGRCFHLKVEELTHEEKELLRREGERIPTHRIRFYDFEIYRVIEGWIKEHAEGKLILAMRGGKEYEFSPFINPKEEERDLNIT